MKVITTKFKKQKAVPIYVLISLIVASSLFSLTLGAYALDFITLPYTIELSVEDSDLVAPFFNFTYDGGSHQFIDAHVNVTNIGGSTAEGDVQVNMWNSTGYLIAGEIQEFTVTAGNSILVTVPLFWVPGKDLYDLNSVRISVVKYKNP